MTVNQGATAEKADLSQEEIESIWSLNGQLPDMIDECIHSIIASKAATHPEKIAVDAWDGRLTYGELEQLSKRLACQLAHFGVGPEVVVPLCFEKSMWTVVAMLGVLKAGGAFALVDVNQPRARLLNIIEQSDAKVICSSVSSRELCSGAQAQVHIVGPEIQQEHLETGIIVLPPPHPAWPMYVCYTSGSTGRPKGIVITHTAFCSAQRHQADAFHFHPEARVFDFSSYSFDVAVYNAMMTLSVGACLCIPSEEQRKGRLNQTLREMAATMVALTPSASRLLEPGDLPDLETLILSGEAVNFDDLERLKCGNFHVLNAYGPAECTPMSTLNANITTSNISISIGRGVGAVTWVVDPNDHTILVPRETIGELLLEGPILAREYLGESVNTAAVFINDPPWLLEGAPNWPGRHGRLYKTGDLVRCEADGSLSFVGRKDTQVKLHGQRIELGEVEYHVRRSIPYAEKVVAEVIHLGGQKERPLLTIFLTCRKDLYDSTQVTEDTELLRMDRSVEKLLAQVLPPYMIPSLYFRVSAMPLSMTAKLNRSRLRELGSMISAQRLVELRGSARGQIHQPQTDAEFILQKLWASVLKVEVESISTDDDFILLGGDSIAAMRLVGAARKLGVALTVADVFRHPTLAMQARMQASTTVRNMKMIPPFSLVGNDSKTQPLREDLAALCKLPDWSLIEDTYPCTPLQEGMFSLSTKRAGDYILQAVLEIHDSVKIQSFKAAWDKMVWSLPILRTKIVQHSQLGLVQVVCKTAIEWSQTHNLEEYLGKDKSDSMGPGDSLCRFALVGSNPSKPGWFVWTIHHALYDGWSLQLMTNIVKDIFCGIIEKKATSYRPSFDTFVQYILQKDSMDVERYWQKYLANIQFTRYPPIPVTLEEPVADASLEIRLPLISKMGVTASTVIRGALAILIGHYTDSMDVVFGATVSGRNAPVAGIEDMLGPTIATVPIRVQMKKDQTISDYLKALQQEATDMIAYEQIGLQRLAKISEEGRSASDFQILLVVQPQADELESDDLFGSWQTSSTQQGFSTYAITLECFITDDSMRAKVSFDTRVMDQWRMETMLQQLSFVLEQLNNAPPGLKISEIELLTAEGRSVIKQWNGPAPHLVEEYIHDLITKNAQEQPDAPAIHSWDGELTHRKLDDLSTQLSLQLATLGVGPEVIVPLCFEKSLFTVIAILGVLKAGGAFVLLDPGLPDNRLRELCRQTKSRIAITSTSNQSRLSDFIPTILVLDWQFFTHTASQKHIQKHKLSHPSNAAYIIFTSGSTGVPKGVIIEHRSYCSAVLSHRALKMNNSMRTLQFGSYNFAGSIVEMLMTLIHGGCLCIPSEEDRGSELARAIRKFNANWAFLTSTVLANLNPEDVPCLKTICVGGEPIRSSQIRQWASKVHLRQTYGSAELSGVVGSARLTESSASTDVGKAISGKFWLVDPINIDQLVPLGVAGEIIFEGPVVGREYIGQPQKTAAAFIQTPLWVASFGTSRPASRFYRTGDLAIYKSDGSIQLLGRKDTQVKLRGQRIEVGEIEQQARLATTGVQEIAVELTDITGATRGPELVGFIVLRKTQETYEQPSPESGGFNTSIGLTLRCIQTRLESVLPYYMVPSLLVPISELPLTATGKTNRRRLREMGSALSVHQLAELRKLAAGKKIQPRTEPERRLIYHWAEALSIEASSIGIDDSFFQLGGDSIAAMKLTGIARKAGLILAVADVFRHPTLAAQAQALKNTTYNTNEVLSPFSLIEIQAIPRLRSELAALCDVTDLLIEDAYPCTPLQEGLLSLTAKRTGDYVLQAVLKLSENVHLGVLQAAWETTFRSISILRTRIVQHSRLGLLQVVCGEEIRWNRSQKLEDYLKEDNERPMGLGFQLSHFGLVDGGEVNSRYFVWTVHHALFDGWSLPLILDIANKAYQANVIVRPPGFNCFVKFLVSLPAADARNYWRSYLANGDFAAFPPLPPSIQEPEADATLELEFPMNLKSETTMSTLIRGSLAVLIHQYTGSSDIVFGATVSGRSAPIEGINEIIGPTIATVPIRIQVNKEQLVADYLEAVQRDAIEMLVHEQMGLQSIAKISEDGRNACTFQTLLVVHPEDKEQHKTDDTLGVWQTPLNNNQGFITYALTLECFLGREVIKVKASYDRGVIDSWKIQQLLCHLGVLVGRLASSKPSQRMKEMCAVTKEDVATISEWNKPIESPVDMCIHNIIIEQAQKLPNAAAVQAWDGALTYQELEKLSESLAYHLTTLGVGPEVVVPLCFEKSMWTVVAILGVLMAGGAFVLLDPGLPCSRLEKVCRQVGATIAMTSASCELKLSSFVSKTIVISWESLRTFPDCKLHRQLDLGPANAAYIIFTSGSTGEPKGVIIEHRSYCSAARHGSVMSMGRDTRALQFGSYNFAGAIMEMLMTLIHGGCICIPSEEQRGTQLTQTIRSLNANWAFLTSTVLAKIRPEDVPSLRTVCVGGEPIRLAQITQWAPRVCLRQTYGSAETSAVVSSALLNVSSTTADIGNATTGRYWIVNPKDTNELVPIGAPGEIVVEGPTVGRGYVGDIERSSLAFISPPAWRASFGVCHPASRFYKTGDLAAYKHDGSIELLGRKDTQVKLRGQRIETGEIEHHIKLATSAIKEVAVELSNIQGNHSSSVELVGFLVIETSHGNADYHCLNDGQFDKQTLMAIQCIQARLESALPHYMVPSVLVPIPKLPLTVSGKTDRRRLRGMATALSLQDLANLRTVTRGERRPPTTEVEHKLRAIWSQVLNVALESISIDDSFFQLGGDSITAMKLVVAARKVDIVLAVADIFRSPVLAAQASMKNIKAKETKAEPVAPFSLLGDEKHARHLREELALLCGLDMLLIEDAYPCTPLQESLLSLTAQKAGNYTMQAVLELPSNVDLARFQAAWEEVISSTPILRTRIVYHSDLGLVQVICKGGIKWRRAVNLENYLQKDKQVSMGLNDCLARFTLVEKSLTGPLFMVWTLHHALYDGWSLPFILERVNDAYRGNPMTKRTEFNAFVKQILQAKYADDAIAYWQSYLADGEFITFPVLPASVQEVKASSTLECSLTLPTTTEATVSTLIRGTIAVLISQYTGSSDVVFGATVSGRNLAVPGIEEIIGPTIATVPVRVQLQKEATIRNFLDRIQQQATEMIAHEQTGLQRISKIDKNCRYACNFQTLLVVQPEDNLLNDDALGIWQLPHQEEGFGTYAIVLECLLGVNEIRLRAGFDTTVISKWQMQNMIQQLSSILSLLAHAQPEQTLETIEALAANDKATIWDWNKSVPEAIESCVHELINNREQLQPNAPAISAWDGELNYRELGELSSRLARHLSDLGVHPEPVGAETIVPLYFEKSKWAVVSMLAVLKAGGAFLLIDPSQALDRSDRIIGIGSKVILTSAGNTHLLARPGYTVVSVNSETLSSFPCTYSTTLPQILPNSAAYAVFTSGSTGQPKGILTDHRAVATCCIYNGRAIGFNPDIRTLQFSSYAFDAFVAEILTTLIFGGCVCIPSDNDKLVDIGKYICGRQVNTAILTPSVARLLDPATIRSLNTIVLCGETPTETDLQQLATVPSLFNAYGPAECTVCSTIGRIELSNSNSNIGQATGSVSWLVSPDDHNILVPIGAVGELLIEGAILARGYIDRPADTAARFIDAPAWLRHGTQDQHGRRTRLYKTGDLARYTEGGTLIYLGRKDRQVKIRGQRLELGEVEYQVRECLLTNAQIIAEMVEFRDREGREVLAIFLDTHTDEKSNNDCFDRVSHLSDGIDLMRMSSVAEMVLSQKLPSYMMPAVYFRLASIPLSASGKVDRKGLRDIAASLSTKDIADVQTAADGGKRQPKTQNEWLLRSVWAQVLRLQVESIGINDSFVRLGGDSITAMISVGEARKLGIELRVSDVLHQPSLRHIADLAQNASKASPEDIPRTQSHGPVEQSYAQGRLWFLDQLHPGSTQYLMPFAIRLHGLLHIDSLGAALLALENRHESLRTTFTSQNGLDLQIIRQFKPRELRVVNIAPDDQNDFLHTLYQEQNTPFELETEPGWRVSLYRFSEDNHVLSIVMHHIISDGWSARVLQKELAKFYSSGIHGRDPLSQVNPLPIQYRDYAAWQKMPRQIDEYRRQLEYWTVQLENSQPAELLCDKSRPDTLSGNAGMQEITIQGSLYGELLRFCKQSEVTPFVVLLAVFRATHYRLTGSKDATIGTANANRDRWQVADMIGFFVNMQCIRIQIETESFEQLVNQVQATMRASLENQDVPFEKIVSKLQKTRDLSRQPLVQMVFALHSQPESNGFNLEGIVTEQIQPFVSSRFDLEFHFMQEEERLRGQVVFSTDLYYAETIGCMLSLFQTILEEGLKNPKSSIESLSLMGHSDYLVLEESDLIHIHQTDYPRESSVIDIFRQQAEDYPDRVAIKSSGHEITYFQLNQSSDDLAWWLTQQSFETEKLVGVYSGRSFQTIVAFLGILKANLAYVPLDTRSPAGRVEKILSTIKGHRLVLVGPDAQPPVTQLENVEYVRIGDILQLPRTESGTRYPAIFPGPLATSLACVMFTSGSTGEPKGVLIEHRGIVRLVKQNEIVKNLPAASVMAHIGNIAFDITTWEIYATILNGGMLVCIDNMMVLDKTIVADVFAKEKIQSAILTPALFKQYLLDCQSIFSQLDLLLVGGDRMDEQDLAVARTVTKGKIINAYGPTENTVISTFYSPSGEEEFANGVPIGRPINNSGAYIMDSQLQLVPMGVLGELVVTGDGLARGYMNFDQNLDQFVSILIDGRQIKAYRTGDRVRYRPVDGQIEFFGRIDAQIKVRGHRIELAEIESVLRSHASVKDAVVVAHNHDGQITRLVGFVSVLEENKEQENTQKSDDNDASQHVKLWEDLFDSDKYNTVNNLRPETIGRDFTAWTSMYDGSLIDKAEMNEWLDDTIQTILNGREPGNVLEIGTGTGMILFNLIDGLQSYVGLEPSNKAIEFVTKTASSIPVLADKFYIQKGTATDICHIKKSISPNLVIINSVVQYFPTQDYLYKVLEDLILLKGVSTIFLGDIRSYALYQEFQVSKALFLLGETATMDEVQHQMVETQRLEQELLVDPSFFTALSDQFPQFVEHIEILPKRMKAINELSSYRYGAVLHLKNRKQPLHVREINEDQWIDFMEQKLDQESLLLLLKQRVSSCSVIAVANIPYKETILERGIVNSLVNEKERLMTEQDWLPSIIRAVRSSCSLSMVDLEELARLSGCRVEISWARQYSQRGGLDAIFHRFQPNNKETRVLFRFPFDDSNQPARSLTSRPLRQRLKQKIQSQLQERLQHQLPPYMIPQKISVIEKMPVTENGKVDREALSKIVPKFMLSQAIQKQPTLQIERQLQRIWGQVLYIDPATIGLDNNFFLLGGDSLLAMKVVAQARKVGINLTVADIFRHPTLSAQGRSRSNINGADTNPIHPFALFESSRDNEEIPMDLATLCDIDISLIEDAYPCTPLQEGMMSLTAKRHDDYVMQAIFEISEHVDLVRFRAAWENVVNYNAILRTRIVQHEHLGLIQVVCREGIKWSEGEELEKYLQQDNLIPMDLGKRLSRFAIIRGKSAKTPPHLVWTIHHALYDGWSLPRIMNLASDIYKGTSVSYGQPGFNTFIKHMLRTKDVDAEAYWRSYLADAESVPFPAPAALGPQPVAPEMLEITLSANFKAEVTISTMLRGALAFVIAQYVGSADVTFGSVVSGRNALIPNIEGILGPTIATVPVRIHVLKKQSILSYLRTIQNDATDAMEFEQTGLHKIANIDDNCRRGCRFQTLLVIQPHETDVPENCELGNWRASATHQRFSSTYPLILECLVGIGEIKARASFDANVVSRSQVENLLHQINAVLGQFKNPKPGLLVENIDPLTINDEATIWKWNKFVPKAAENCIHDLISERARLHPDALAVYAWDGELSYKDLESFSALVALQLVNLGVGGGTIVPVCFEKSKWAVVAMLAVLKAGGAFLPIDPTHVGDRVDQIIKETAANIILTSTQYEGIMARPDCTVISISSSILSSFPDQTQESFFESRDQSKSRATPKSTAYVIFTSGSTGQPKGVLIDHNAASTSCLCHGRAIGFNRDTRTLQFSSYTFDACIMEIMTTLLFGGCICVPSDTERLIDIEESIDRMAANLCFLTPTVARLLNPAQVPSLKTILLGGEKVSHGDFHRWTSSSTAFVVYGPTECAIICSVGNSNTHQGGSFIGQGIGSVLWVTSPENHNRLMPIGAVGELLVEGATLAQGYFDRPEETAAAFIENPTWLTRGTEGYPGRNGRLYKTGDLVRYNENGTLTYLGRKDTQVKIRGQRIELSEIEHHVRECTPFVIQAIAEVVELSAEQNRPILSVFLQSGDDNNFNHSTSSPLQVVSNIGEDVALVRLRSDIETVLSQRLPAYMIPMLYFRVSKLPLMSSTKTDRRKLHEFASVLSLQKLAELQMANRADKRPPRTQTERTLQHLWAQTLDIEAENISIDDTFHGLGGDSITAMKLVVASRKVGISLAVMDVLKFGTLATLAANHDQKAQDTRSSVSAEAFSLLGHEAKDEIIRFSKSLVSPQEVADVYPATDFQKDVIKLSMQWPRQSLNYLFIDFGPDLDLDRLKFSCRSVLERYSMLRSVFVSFEGTFFQVILKEMSQQLSIFDFDEDLDKSSYEICLADTNSGFQLGYSPTLFMLVRSKESQGSRLILRCSHAQYDGFCLPGLITSLLDIYQGNSLRPIVEFADFLLYKRLQQADSSTYWQRLLQGSSVTQLSHILLPEANRLAALTSAPEKVIVEDKISIPQLPAGINLASIINSAWALVLSEMTGKEDIVYGSLIFGRDASMPGIEDIFGPCLNIVPIRAHVFPGRDPHELLLSVQEQNLSAQAHSLGIDEIAKHSINWPVGVDFDSVVQHQNIDENPEFKLMGKSLKLGWFDNPYHIPPKLVIMSYAIQGGVKIRILANSHITSFAIAEALLASVCKTVTSLVTSQYEPLFSSSLNPH